MDQIYTLPRNFEVDKETIRTHEGSSVTGDGLDGFFDIEITRENVNGEKTVWVGVILVMFMALKRFDTPTQTF